MTDDRPTRSEVHAAYEEEVARIRNSGETHPQAITMAMNEARRWLDRALDTARPDNEDGRPLGARLRENIRRREDERQEKERRQRLEEERRRNEHREKCLSWFNGWIARVGDEIATGGVPGPVRLPRLLDGRERWKMNVSDPGHDDHWLWREHMDPWARREGIVLRIEHDHDGVGMESWWNLVVSPA